MRRMLDTNTVSHFIKGRHALVQRVTAIPMASLCISAITHGELMYGLAKRPDATRLRAAVHEFIMCVDTLPWDEDVAKRYGVVRADLERRGSVLAPLDLQIAAHAITAEAILVTNDRAFSQVDGLALEDWSVT